MLNKKFNYYGFDKDVYLSVGDLRHQTNQRHTEIIITFFLIMMLSFSAMSLLDIISYSHRYMYFLYTALGVVFEAVLLLFRKFTNRYPTVFMYLAFALLIAFSVSSSNSETFQVATIYPAFAVLIGVAFIDNMLRFSAAMIISCVIFIYSSFIHKPPSIFRYDMIYSIIFTVIALMFHFRFQRSRINQFLAYHKNLEIQRDLEIRSSFDALSSLLIRARFFSMADSILRARQEEQYAALCILDLDSFKQINDRFGHQMGDKAIQTAGNVIWSVLGVDISEKWSFCERAVMEKMSFAGRLGGDEFVIFLWEEGGWETTENKLRDILNNLNAVEMGELKGIHASFGVTEISMEDMDVDEVYNRADEALYKAKTSGKNQIVKG